MEKSTTDEEIHDNAGADGVVGPREDRDGAVCECGLKKMGSGVSVELAGAVVPARFEQGNGFVEIALSRVLSLTDGGPLAATIEWD